MKDIDQKTELEDLIAGAADSDRTERILYLLNALRTWTAAAWKYRPNDSFTNTLIRAHLELLGKMRKKTELCKRVRVRVVQV